VVGSSFFSHLFCTAPTLTRLSTPPPTTPPTRPHIFVGYVFGPPMLNPGETPLIVRTTSSKQPGPFSTGGHSRGAHLNAIEPDFLLLHVAEQGLTRSRLFVACIWSFAAFYTPRSLSFPPGLDGGLH